LKNGALAGLKPGEIWEMELWEYNTVISTLQEKHKCETANAILTGYYVAYYMNGGKKAKNPNELIKSMYTKKQSLEDGLRDIEKLKKTEREIGDE
jgi:hypothetical protein